MSYKDTFSLDTINHSGNRTKNVDIHWSQHHLIFDRIYENDRKIRMFNLNVTFNVTQKKRIKRILTPSF